MTVERTSAEDGLETPGFTEETPEDCSCPGCAAGALAARLGAARAAHSVTSLHGVRRAVVTAAGLVALTAAGTGTAAAEPAPAHAGWDGSRYWFRNASGEWRWTGHESVYLQRTTGAGSAAGPARKPVFRGRQGWDARDRVYWFRSGGHWYWTSHLWKYEQRTGGAGGQGSAARPSRPAPGGGAATRGWTAPVESYVFTGTYGERGSWSRGYHTGQDFAVPSGTPVRAVGPGRVVRAGYAGAYGYEVVVRHPDGRYTQYAHLSRVDVSAGQSVSGGQRIARSGATGRVTGPHLHFEVRTGPSFGTDVHPLAYLRGHGVRI
ncbi:M23 family metallopeptidase [Streptomyces hydrogenans]|uniref:M23 family metallopeptidase n=1 Tax=Streptomyces hydrogenans TaxID=1873719 RepID=UPI00382A5C70